MATKYILNHPTGQYQINLSGSLVDFKKKLAEGKDMLTLFHLDGSYYGVVDPSFLDESEITEEK